MYQSEKKREKFSNQIRVNQRRKIFYQKRKCLQEAIEQQNQQMIKQAQRSLMLICHNNPDTYKMLMEMADKIDRQQKQFQQHLADLEEESVTFQMKQRQDQIKQILSQLQEELKQQSQSEKKQVTS